jgi:hypothetical protein
MIFSRVAFEARVTLAERGMPNLDFQTFVRR